MRAIVVSDIHGDYEALINYLTSVNFNEDEDMLITLGDNFDRGVGNLELYHFLQNLPHKILIMGNHELALLNVLKSGKPNRIDLHNGTVQTIADLAGCKEGQAYWDMAAIDAARRTGIESWIKNEFQWYFETDEYIFVHGWIPTKFLHDDEYLPLDEADGSDWFDAAWCNTEKKIEAFRNVFPHGMDKTIVFGHWGTFLLYQNIDGVDIKQGNYDKIWKNDQLKLIGLDCTTAISHHIEGLIIEV